MQDRVHPPPLDGFGGSGCPPRRKDEELICIPMNDPQTVCPPESGEPLLAGVPEQKPKRHTGTVGRLPKQIRDRINELMLDGHTYREVIAELGKDGAGLTEDHLGSWNSGGYAEWLRGRERREDVLFVQEA